MSSRVFTKDIMRDGVFTQENERRRMRTIFEARLLFALEICFVAEGQQALDIVILVTMCSQ